MPSPFQQLSDLPHVTLRFVDLPDGLLGFCDHDTDTIWLTKGMRQRQRRAVLQHELEHLRRGRVASNPHFANREEVAVEQATAHALIPFHSLYGALQWTRDAHELACELHAPVDLVVVRMNHLHPSETIRIRAMMANQDEARSA